MIIYLCMLISLFLKYRQCCEIRTYRYQSLSEGILHYFNDQLGEAWLVQTHARIDEITSIQRALNILKRALSRCQLSSKCLV